MIVVGPRRTVRAHGEPAATGFDVIVPVDGMSAEDIYIEQYVPGTWCTRRSLREGQTLAPIWCRADRNRPQPCSVASDSRPHGRESL